MKKQIALFTLVTAALLAVPAISRAQDAAPESPAAAAPKKHGLMFHGKVTAVDAAAMTVTVAEGTYNVTSDTKIAKDGQPATFADITVGASVGGAYKKAGDKMNATSIHIGEHGKKKKAE